MAQRNYWFKANKSGLGGIQLRGKGDRYALALSCCRPA